MRQADKHGEQDLGVCNTSYIDIVSGIIHKIISDLEEFCQNGLASHFGTILVIMSDDYCQKRCGRMSHVLVPIPNSSF